MRQFEFPDNVVRIWSRDHRQVIGTGFLVGQHVITCAHVASAAAAQQVGDKVQFSTLSGETCEAQLIAVGDDSQRSGDWAVATLLGGNGISGVLQLKRELTPGHPFMSFGFPHDWTEFGAHVEGICGSRNAVGLVELQANTKGFQIGPGFSGAPVIDKIKGAAIGHIVGNDASGISGVAFMLPILSPLSAVAVLQQSSHLENFSRSDFQRIAELSDEPSLRGRAVRYVIGSVLPSVAHDPASRYWAYLTLGYLGGDAATSALSAAEQCEENTYVRGGVAEAKALLGR